MPTPEMIEGAKIILFKLGKLTNSETLCIITDSETKTIGNIFEKISKENQIKTLHHSINPLKMHGESLPDFLEKAMRNSDLILGLTKLSMAHSSQRIAAESHGSRYLSLPDYSIELLTHPALRANYDFLAKKAEILAKEFSNGKKIRIQTKEGTHIELDISHRKGNFAPGFVNDEIKLGSPPDIEANIAPVENETNGIIVVDGSISHPSIGKLSSPVSLTIKKGKLESLKGDEKTIQSIEKLFQSNDINAKILGEYGVGFNDQAKLCGNMLLDEGCFGTMHFGFGSNIILGGKNVTNFHLDFIIFANELIVDGKFLNIEKIAQ